MTIVTFLTQLAGATLLLLYAVRMVRTGIERAFGASFRRAVTKTSHPLSAIATGLVLAIVLQSSAAVGLLVAGFAGTGALNFMAGLSIVLGADLGSALLIQVLSFNLEWLVPVLLALGGGFFIHSDRRKLKQAGRIILGIAFILISLRFLRETMDPIRDSAFLPAIAGYLEQDFVTAFIAGAGLAVLMHSSVAVILMCVTLVAIQSIPVAAGVSLVLGANLGSALIPIWLSRGMGPVARRLPVANLVLRGTGAIIALVLVNKLPIVAYLGTGNDAQTLIYVHILFNTVLVFSLPLGKYLQGPLENFIPDTEAPPESTPFLYRSVLDESSVESPQLALACLRREVMRVAQIVESMTVMVLEAQGQIARDTADAIQDHYGVVNTALDDIRRFVAAMQTDDLSKKDQKQARELVEYAISLVAAADVVNSRLLVLTKEKSDKSIQFSRAGAQELIAIHERSVANMALASNVLVFEDLESARLLLEEKNEMARLERSSRKKHLNRLSKGEAISFDSSDIHLETLRAIRDFNSYISSVAYPILYRNGQLLETRLIETLKDDDAPDIED